MEIISLLLILILSASFFQGTFGLGMKYMAPLKWETWWLIHAFVGMVIVPMVWASIVIPDLYGVIANTNSSKLFLAALYGFLWGIGGILFGVSVEKTEISITYNIVMGLAASMGAIIPLFQIEDIFSQPSFLMILLGVALLLIGVAITAVAGVQRAQLKMSSQSQNKTAKPRVLIAVVSVVLSAFLNIGFSNDRPAAQVAVDQYRIKVQKASLASWVVVLLGAFSTNSGYAVFRLIQNKSWDSYSTPNSKKAYQWAIISGIFWFAALGVYGQGAALMGNLGPVIGWPILLGTSLIISNVWAYKTNEWKRAKTPFRALLMGLAVLIIAI